MHSADRLEIVTAGPTEVVQGPFQSHLGLRVAASPCAVRQEESLVAGDAGSQRGGDDAYCPRRLIAAKREQRPLAPGPPP